MALGGDNAAIALNKGGVQPFRRNLAQLPAGLQLYWKTFAMQGLFDLTVLNPAMRERTADLIRSLTRTGTAAMRARGRQLLNELESR